MFFSHNLDPSRWGKRTLFGYFGSHVTTRNIVGYLAYGISSVNTLNTCDYANILRTWFCCWWISVTSTSSSRRIITWNPCESLIVFCNVTAHIFSVVTLRWIKMHHSCCNDTLRSIFRTGQSGPILNYLHRAGVTLFGRCRSIVRRYWFLSYESLGSSS